MLDQDDNKKTVIWNIIDESTEFDIRPSDINSSRRFSGAFGGHMPTEILARYIVLMCQEKDRWSSFTDEDFKSFCSHLGYDHFSFYRLAEPDLNEDVKNVYYETSNGWIVKGEDERYRVTDEFIYKCYDSSPASNCGKIHA
ncbi:MAG: hypothetical protein WC536_00885 [Patescibacteria group bacterium]